MGLSYSHGSSRTALLDETIGANLERIARRFGDREALVSRHQQRRYTYAQLDGAVDALARGLIAAGVEAGDRVGIWAPNCAEWVLTQYATAKAGAILVNINPAYRVAELEYALRQSGVRLLISATDFKTSDYRAMVSEVRGSLPSLERAVYIGTPGWDELIAGGETVPAFALRSRMAGLSCEDAINIQYTSGTTGFPKGATLSHRNILNNGYLSGGVLGYTEADRVCVPVPLYHCFGMVLGSLGAITHGACLVLPSPAFDPGETLAAVAEERCTSLYGVPTMFIAELEHPDFGSFDLSSLRTGMMGGAPCPVEVMRDVVRDMHMEEVAIVYGMTETSPASTLTRRDDSLERRVETVGRPLPHVEVQIVSPETGAVVGVGSTGELCTRGYSVMLGYWDEPDKTAEAIDADGWMHTGDLATMDTDGYCKIVGRIKDMVIRGGENIYPREIEELLFTHPDVVDAQVVGVPDERYGEELVAWIRVRPGASLDAGAVRDFCGARIARFKVPRHVLFADAFPMTVTGKPQKFKLRELSITRLAAAAA
jgi:fatty-acyl-CoA synthase